MQVALARMPAVKTICEIGFNSGHSASVWLAVREKTFRVFFPLRIFFLPLFFGGFIEASFSVEEEEKLSHVSPPRVSQNLPSKHKQANPNAKVIMFDLWEHAYAPKAEAWLRSPAAAAHGIVDGDARLTVVKGSSLETVPEFAADNPDVKCDLISVDGGHTYDVALKDLEYMHLLANRE